MDVVKQHAERVRRTDPLIAPQGALPAPGPGQRLIEVPGAVGLAGVSRSDLDSLVATWGPLVNHTLRARVTSADAFGELLDRWEEGVGERGDDHALVVTWPSRDTSTVLALARRGFSPQVVIAARLPRPVQGSAPAGGFGVRPAEPGDLDRMHRLYEQLVAYDAQFGWLRFRASTSAGLRKYLADVLKKAEPWCWVAEREGEVVGMMTVEPPESSGWIAPFTTAAPVAYLGQAYLDPTVRGTGLGDALGARVSAHVDAAGMGVTLLHYAVANPLSGPFWARQGYRPLFTTWGKHL